MVRYVSTALALKCFSATPATRSLYRTIGNRVGQRRRSSGKMPGYYFERVKRIVRLVNEHQILRDGDRVMEIGTGWLHWEALTVRLFWDIEAVLYDVWDNRQLGGLKNYCQQLGPMIDAGNIGLSRSQVDRAQALLRAITLAKSFEELYQLLGFRYVVEATGSLEQFRNDTFQVVVSGGVLEHVTREAVPMLVCEMRRILKPGGWAVHSIDTADHLSHYDATVPTKYYLSVPEPTWKRMFENKVQYINRLQRSEWLRLFADEDFTLIDEDGSRIDLGSSKLAPPYSAMDREDLERTVLRFAFQAPNTSSSVSLPS
jgi:SAM-dependent methyltransferase